jgi:Flp pilus assembly protein TadD
MQTGRSDQAVTVLERALTEHPREVGIAHNLARLLATSTDPRVRNGPRALELALQVRDKTAGSDPRALDTLAEAYAATGRLDLARETSLQATALAQKLGDEEQAREIAGHARAYARR